MNLVTRLAIAGLLLTGISFGMHSDWKWKRDRYSDGYRYRNNYRYRTYSYPSYNYPSYNEYYRPLPPGIAKRRYLPPGIQKKLYRDYRYRSEQRWWRGY